MRAIGPISFMSNRPRLDSKTCTFIKTEHPHGMGPRWFPVIGGTTIDQRGDGHASKAAVRRWAADRALYCGEIITLKFS